jgi:hypothetical protein
MGTRREEENQVDEEQVRRIVRDEIAKSKIRSPEEVARINASMDAVIATFRGRERIFARVDRTQPRKPAASR